MKLPVQPGLFDLLLGYANAMKRGEVTAGRIMRTSPALVFCQNFYGQFFQNELKHEITSFAPDAKAQAVRLRLRLKQRKTRVPRPTIQLITWFEKLCDIYPAVLAIQYGPATRTAFRSFHAEYLMTLVRRIRAWAKVRKYQQLDKKAQSTVSALEDAVEALADAMEDDEE